MLTYHLDEGRYDGFRYNNGLIFTGKSLQLEENGFLPDRFPGKKTYLLTDRRALIVNEKKLGPMIQTLDGFSDEEISKSVFYVFFNFDSNALPLIKRIKDNGGIFIPPVLTGKIMYHYANKIAFDAVCAAETKSSRISHINLDVWNNICEALDITKKLEGDFVEIGVYLGGSALLAMCCIDYMRHAGSIKPRKAFLLDTFDGFNYEESQNSSDQIWKDTHKLFGKEGTIKYVAETFTGVDTEHKLFANNICTDELPEEIQKIAVANIDVDMYEPTLSALNKVSDLIVPGGIIICEDAASTPGLYGAYLAMEEFLESEKGQSYIKVFKGAQYFLIKRG